MKRFKAMLMAAVLLLVLVVLTVEAAVLSLVRQRDELTSTGYEVEFQSDSDPVNWAA